MSDCVVCETARVTGWWGQNGTHCGLEPSGNDCHRSWSAMREAHCAVCHQHFTSDSVAVLHEPYCTPDPVVTAESMVNARYVSGSLLFEVVDRKSGLTWLRRREAAHYRVTA